MMNEQITEIAMEIGWLMGRDAYVYTQESDAVIRRIAKAAESFSLSDGGDWTQEMQSYAEQVYNQLVSDGMVGSP